MHRALGGASTSRVQWRSLGRSLRANFNACAAQLVLQPGGGRLQHQRPHWHVITSKKQIFLGFVRYAAINE
jgi:hypothetical protein